LDITRKKLLSLHPRTFIFTVSYVVITFKAHMGEVRGAYNILVERPEGR
jgi:hypothetical protein